MLWSLLTLKLQLRLPVCAGRQAQLIALALTFSRLRKESYFNSGYKTFIEGLISHQKIC